LAVINMVAGVVKKVHRGLLRLKDKSLVEQERVLVQQGGVLFDLLTNWEHRHNLLLKIREF